MNEINPGELIAPEVKVSDLFTAVGKCKPSVEAGQLEEYEKFTEEFGQVD